MARTRCACGTLRVFAPEVLSSFPSVIPKPLLSVLALSLTACASQPAAPSPCSNYCQTQQDGYEWAQRAVLLDPRACEGYAPEFVRGCKESVRDYSQSKSPREGW